MKKIAFCVMCVAALMLTAITGSAQTVVQTTDVTVVYNGALPSATFEDVSRFYFQDENLVMDQHGVLTEIPFSTVHKLELSAVATPVLDVVDEWNESAVLVYPNPASDRLFFASQQERQVDVAVYAMDGRKLFSQQLSTDGFLDVSALPNGFYVVKINNVAYKFSKL